MRDLSLDDYDDSMDTSNAIQGVSIELVQGENREIMFVQKKIVSNKGKPPASKSAKSAKVLADIRKIIQKIGYKILLENYESAPQEQPEIQKEYLDPMAMDIDVAQLKNTKDLLTINVNVNKVDIQCLADFCTNVSFIQEEAVLELKLKADKSIKHSITSVSGPILKGYKHREIGLS
ncbi:hypothetical protein RclHR1_00520006 [Rhizophagus clarus]|uniref:Uncharacterized protein n=1 Tax=Rhizophagus clarus TaxID=94130 RepID=A0A2Z6RMA4_9GLOM|nr:hypothetical protein RclHR1_00520006 [Rhizophagus clarus]